MEGNFLSLPNSEAFPVGVKDNSSVSTIPSKLKDAQLMLQGKISLWSANSALAPDWPSSLLKAKFSTDETATTPEQAYEKYSVNNVEWEFASTTAYDLVFGKYEALLDNDKKVFEAWLKDEPKALLYMGIFLRTRQ
jgi:hypothetical protein